MTSSFLSLSRTAWSLVAALCCTLALAVICRFLPGGTGDRSGGVAAQARDPSLPG